MIDKRINSGPPTITRTTHHATRLSVMSTFNWLLVAHLVGDWMLQNDWIARNKQRRWFTSAILVHCTIYTLTLLVALWFAPPLNNTPLLYLTFGALIFLTHWVIDAGNLAATWMSWFHQSDVTFVRIMVDQTMHVVVLALLAEWLLA
jgi:hypothetical protein